MRSTQMSRPVSVVLLGGVAVLGLAGLTAGCSPTKEKPATRTEQSSAPAPSSEAPGTATVSPTEKRAPTLAPGGPNSFSPSILAPPAPTALPGNVITGG